MATSVLPEKSEWLRASVTSRPVGVDRKAKMIRGYVVAQLGVFKNEDRGEFDADSLTTIVRLMNEAPKGLKSRFAHPTLSGDGIGKYLGRASNAWLDGDRVRADLRFDETAFRTPSGDLATYLMDLAESDPDALSSSLVLRTDKQYRLGKNNKPALNEDTGEPLPPIWRPTKLHASDIVDTGEAVDGLLGFDADGLPDEFVRHGTDLLNDAFSGQPRAVVKARCEAWLDRYLSYRFGDESPEPDRRGAESRRRQLELRQKLVDRK